MYRKFKSWAKTDCDECGCEYQVTRTEPREMESCICGDCEIYDKAYQEGVDSVSNKKQLANTIRLNMIAHAFNEYQMTVSSITTHTDAHLIRIGGSLKEQ